MHMDRSSSSIIFIKFIATTIAAWIAFSIFDTNTFGWVLLIGLFGTVLNYTVGDLMILPRTTNLMASLADGGLSLLLILTIDWLSDRFDARWTALFIFVVLIIIIEYFFHRWLDEI